MAFFNANSNLGKELSFKMKVSASITSQAYIEAPSNSTMTVDVTDFKTLTFSNFSHTNTNAPSIVAKQGNTTFLSGVGTADLTNISGNIEITLTNCKLNYGVLNCYASVDVSIK